ncbi:MAG: hypothetical protein ABSH46_07205 [Bryobacteraceae bacterium]
MKWPKSKVGWAFVILYLVSASYLIYQAFACRGWVCDLVEIPAAVPFGLVYLLALRWLDPFFAFGDITWSPFRNWFFIVPTVIGNSLIFYWLGVGVGKLAARLLGRRAA